MNPNSRIYVAGGDTLIGVALRERLREEGFTNLVGEPPNEPDLVVAGQVEDFFGEVSPEYVFHVGGRAGGIELNRTRPAELMLHNLLAVSHVMDAAHRHGVSKLLYLASSCTYPKHAAQPLQVESLMTGALEPTNAAYAAAKLAGWQLCMAYRQQYDVNFITGIPANVFGPHDDFGPAGGHVIPALICRMHEAKRTNQRELSIWGTGTPRREFIDASDLADACLFVMSEYNSPEPINLGSGTALSVVELAEMLAEIVGYRGRLQFDTSKPDGMPLKVLDSSPLHRLGWRPSRDFRASLERTYTWFQQHVVKEESAHERARV